MPRSLGALSWLPPDPGWTAPSIWPDVIYGRHSCAKYVSLGLVGDLAQDCSLCFVGLSTSELAIPHSAGEVLGVHGRHLRNGLLPLRGQLSTSYVEFQGP